MSIKKRQGLLFTLIFIFLFSVPKRSLSADREAMKADPPHAPERERSLFLEGLTVFLLTEGMIGLNAGMASVSPTLYGSLGLLSTPLMFVLPDGPQPVPTYLGVAGFAGVCAYNILELEKEKYSQGDRFRHNIIAFHIFGAYLFGMSFLFPEKKSSKEKANLRLRLTPQTAEMVWAYRFN